MKAWVLHETEGPGAYRLEEVEDPRPGAGEARVRLEAAGLNHLDIWVSRGLPRPELPHVAGADGAGVVAELGPEVTGLAEGDEVVLNPSLSCGRCPACRRGDVPLCPDYGILGEHRWGTFAQSVVVPAVNLLPKPERLSWAEAAAFGLTTGTALRMLERAGLRPGDTLLVVGVGGGVSSAAMLLGLAMGARVYVTSTSPEKIERAVALGARAGFASDGEFSRELKEVAGGGADVVIENVGPATWDQSIRSLAPDGRLAVCGGTSGTKVELHLPSLWFKQLRIVGSTMFDHGQFRRTSSLVAEGTVPVLVDREFPFQELPAALAYLEEGKQFGKIVVRHR